MDNIEKLIVQNFEDRFEQVKGISDYLTQVSTENLELINKVKESEEEESSKFTSDITTFKKNEMSMTLLSQQLQSLISRVIEYYTIIKMADLPTSLSEKDEKFLEGFMQQKMDLFGIEKGNLVVLDKEYHDVIMQQISVLKPNEAEQIFTYMKTAK